MSKVSSYESFLLKDELSVVEGEGGIPFIKIDNQYASATISIYGAQVLSYKLKPQKDADADAESLASSEMLFMSDKAYFEDGKAIKGGIPICWPWFAKDAENPDRQMHGFARNMHWQLEGTASVDNGDTEIILSLSDSKESFKIWPHEFKVIVTIVVGKTLKLSLHTVNTGSQPFTITQALHTYFSIADIEQVTVKGLNGVSFLDKVKGAKKQETQQDQITVNQEVDRIYIDAPDCVTLCDEKLKREVKIETQGSNTTIVWNPWIDISKNSNDLSDDAYQRFICVETANAADEVIVIEPSNSYTIAAEYSASFH